MSKFKVRCSVCGKSFKTPSTKKTICPACEAEAKRAKHVAAPAPVQPAKPLSSSVDVRAALRAAQQNQGQFGAYRAPEPPPPPEAAPDQSPASAKIRQERSHAGPASGVTKPAAKPAARGVMRPRPAHAAPAVKPERQKRAQVRSAPFVPTDEQVTAIRERYMALAQPEFDGIRHKIANELGIPLRVVKDVVKTIRAETATPSWWERTGAVLEPAQVARIKEMYLPMLPMPTVGVHKQIAAELKLSHTSVYQAIGAIRAEMELPRYSVREGDAPPIAPDTQVWVDEQPS